MLLASIEAANILGLDILAGIIADLTAFGGQALLALVIFGLGLYLANLARSVIVAASGEGSAFTANLARIAILVFAAALALQQLGIWYLAGDNRCSGSTRLRTRIPRNRWQADRGMARQDEEMKK